MNKKVKVEETKKDLRKKIRNRNIVIAILGGGILVLAGAYKLLADKNEVLKIENSDLIDLSSDLQDEVSYLNLLASINEDLEDWD
jgi:hypothetical protein